MPCDERRKFQMVDAAQKGVGVLGNFDAVDCRAVAEYSLG